MVEAAFTLGGAVLAILVGVAYFAGARSDSPLWQRCLASSFGPAVAALFVVAAFLWPESYRYKPSGVRAFYLLQLLPLMLQAYSLRYYTGPRSFHFFLVPIGLLAWLWTFAIGFLSVHGE